MTEFLRRSPVSLPGIPKTLEVIDHWEVIQAFKGESRGPALIDLSLIPRWDAQLENVKALGREDKDPNPPERPGQCILDQGLLCARLNPWQRIFWNLGLARVSVPDDAACTDITDATVVLALLGREAYGIMEKLSSMDLAYVGTEDLVVLQGPVAHVACQVVVLCGGTDHVGVLVSCARGYGAEMGECLLSAGRSLGLQPAGFGRFSSWINNMDHHNH